MTQTLENKRNSDAGAKVGLGGATLDELTLWLAYDSLGQSSRADVQSATGSVRLYVFVQEDAVDNRCLAPR
jgi:hypothetical protein